MTNAGFPYLIVPYLALVVFNLLISIWFWRRSRFPLYASLVKMWGGMLYTTFVSGATAGKPYLFLTVALIPGGFLCTSSTMDILLRFIDERPRRDLLRWLPVVALLGCTALYYSGTPFWIYSIPATVMFTAPVVYGLARLMKGKKERLTPAKLGFAVVSAVTVLHGLDIPFLANRVDTISIGLAIGMMIGLSFSIFGPLVMFEIARAEADRYQKELREAEGILELVADTASLLTFSLDYEGVLGQTAKLAQKHLGGVCAIHVIDESGKVLRLTRSNDLGAMGQSFEALSDFGQGPARAFVSGHAEIGSLATAQASNPLSFIAVPLFDRGRAEAILTVFSMENGFGLKQRRLACELANRASVAIQNAKLHEAVMRAVRLRDDFLSIASHELKTPLTPLSILVETLLRLVEREKLDSIPSDQLKKMMQTSAEQLKSLTKLIDGLLDVTRVAANGVVLGKKEDVDLGKLTLQIVDRFSPQFQEAGSRVEMNVKENVIGHWDRIRVEQVVTNLVSNAIKYGTGRPIRIEVGAQGENGLIRVQDYGIGIAKVDQERIFERFERAVPVRRFGGLGLGLYIIREIARAHEGSVRVASEPGKETTFTVELPLKAS